MNCPADKDQLLTDVLADESSGGFRAALLTETLGLARRRRRFRQVGRAASGLAIFVGLAVLVWRNLPSPVVTPESAGKGYTIVRSQLLRPAALVNTQPLAPSRLVTSARSADTVRTAPGGGQIREIDDAELLALVGPKPVALVRQAPHSAELVFVNPADRDELLRN
jgi:hypothetical protein